LVRQPKTAVFSAEIEVRIYRTPALKVFVKYFVLSKILDTNVALHFSCSTNDCSVRKSNLRTKLASAGIMFTTKSDAGIKHQISVAQQRAD